MLPFNSRTYPQALGTPESLMIMDMQQSFLLDPREIHISDYEHARNNLIRKVKERIAYHMDSGNDIIIVNYKNGGNLIAEIEQQFRNYNPLKLDKNKDSLLHALQNNRHEAIHGLHALRNSQLEIVGVNASDCVLKTCASLFDHNFSVKVNVECVLNTPKKKAFDSEDFRKFNSLAFLQKSYREFNGIYHDDDYFPMKRDFSFLLNREISLTEERFIWEL